jgi:hypothetical protein
VQSRARMFTRHTRNSPLAPQHTREVVSPQRTDLVLAADVPDVEFGVLVSDRLDVEADGGDGRDVLVKLELVEDCWVMLVSCLVAIWG